ncbi:MAG: alanine racemase, partial [Ktedonobacterales bacterium]
MHGDGHDYALDALERGAGALLLEQGRLGALLAAAPDLREHARATGTAVLVVPDTREALKAYAAHILRQWQPQVIAVTGSTGKTTTKEAIADVLGILAPTFRSWRNYNDLLGLPLSLGALEPTHRYAVVELGADHPSEIADLCALVRPWAGVVTNVSPAHLRYFGSVNALGTELGRLPALLPSDGLAILNGDDSATRAMVRHTSAHALFYGLGDASDGFPAYALEPLGAREPPALTLRASGAPGAHPLVFPHLHGDHWAYVVLAALAVGQALGVEHDAALEVLRRLRPLPGRMRWLDGIDNLVLLDDSHNATPASAAAGLRALHAIAQQRMAPAIAVLGDMLHLGEIEERAHRELGRLAASCADYLVARGAYAQLLADEAVQCGLSPDCVAVTLPPEDAARAVERFASAASSPAVVYLKGSEDVRMEQVTLRLLARPEEAEHVLDRQTQAWRRVVVMRPDRPTWLEVDLSAIGQNTRLVKELVGPRTQVLVSLKADAYGHGALRVARTVLHNGASWLGVATVSEAESLRTAGISAPILVFGYTAPWQAREAVRLNVRATIYAREPAQALARAARDLDREVRVHVK